MKDSVNPISPFQNQFRMRIKEQVWKDTSQRASATRATWTTTTSGTAPTPARSPSSPRAARSSGAAPTPARSSATELGREGPSLRPMLLCGRDGQRVCLLTGSAAHCRRLACACPSARVLFFSRRSPNFASWLFLHSLVLPNVH